MEDNAPTPAEHFEALQEVLLTEASDMFPMADQSWFQPDLFIPSTQGEKAQQLVSIISFFSNHFQGSLVVSCYQKNLPVLMPELLEFEGYDMWGDALNELANQLLGRFKNQLVPRDVVLHMGTPTALGGSELTVLPANKVQHSTWLHQSQGEEMLLVVRFTATIEPDFVLGEKSESISDSMLDNGEMLFF